MLHYYDSVSLKRKIMKRQTHIMLMSQNFAQVHHCRMCIRLEYCYNPRITTYISEAFLTILVRTAITLQICEHFQPHMGIISFNVSNSLKSY